MIEPGSIQVCGLHVLCVYVVLCVWYILYVVYASSVIPCCLFKHFILFYVCLSVCNEILLIVQ